MRQVRLAPDLLTHGLLALSPPHNSESRFSLLSLPAWYNHVTFRRGSSKPVASVADATECCSIAQSSSAFERFALSPLINRRETLKLLAVNLAAGIVPRSPAVSLFSEEDPLRYVLDLPRGRFFGVKSDGASLMPGGLYRASTPNQADLSFDLSNQQLAASLTATGAIRRAVLCTGLEWLPTEKMAGGIYSVKHLRYTGSCTVEVMVEDGSRLAGLPVSVDLVANHLPLFHVQAGELNVSSLFFMPEEDSSSARCDRSPRAIFQTIYLENRSHDLRRVQLHPLYDEAVAKSAENDEFARHRHPSALVRVFALDPGAPVLSLETDATPIVVLVPARTVVTRTVAWLIGEDIGELDATEKHLCERPVAEWLAMTLSAHALAFGDLTLQDDRHTAELIPRLAQLSRQSILRRTTGQVSGGFLGSDVDLRPINWVRDNFYSMLAASLFAPRLCADSIPYFLEWGFPSKATGRGLRRLPHATGITQSLTNTLSGPALAGAYYRSTGDTAYFLRNRTLYEQAKAILEAVLATRVAEPMLFPSLYVSDGDARGDFNTGANVVAWFSFQSFSRLAGEVFADRETSARFAQIAAAIERDLAKYCTGQLASGKTCFFEGGNLDGTLIQGHDGEESDTTLMSFYGFCPATDERLKTHARMATEVSNPFYSPALDAVWWFNERWKSATFPAFVTALAGAGSAAEQAARIARIGRLTDLDGSFWWWPYRYGSTDRLTPLRADGARKCGWAAGTYLCLLTSDIMGIKVDVPARQLSLAPDMPWKALSWQQMRLGTATFDLSVSNTDTSVVVRVTNRNEHPYLLALSLRSLAEQPIELLHLLSDESAVPSTKQTSKGRNITEARLLPMQEVILTFKKAL